MKYLLLIFLATAQLACGQDNPPAPASPTASAPAPAPTYENLSQEDFAQRMQEENVVVLDVRTPGEIQGGKIEGAVEIDFRDPDFAQKIEALDREPTYLVYCAVGGRSSQACEQMAEAGFHKVYNLEGGYTAWSGR
ncbi:rhodanese-related sulfurtransferase [Lewinella marina]|uniref:Rhodanese domain-containing protein n=1 Tax=Neolewinella marina TaxID=438751 RepID=A0A2G0CBL3_9BACT|nr:rhodanese-like domain-containing protein [Neolewinella marina]NJB87143.1 rhodanese-related sulfurtransferase [Neolewinella marina]PHK97330.1 hypothetical protein CGL56_16115 [Neolewinella marina]